jgi:hypothetical protein
MTPEWIFGKFNEVFGYLIEKVTKYQTIKNDPRSIRLFMKDGTVYIFTYPANGHYTLVVEKLGKVIQEEKENE